MRKKLGVTKECAQCKNLFYVPLYRKDTAKFCSISCNGKYTLTPYISTYGFQRSNKPKHKYKTKVLPNGEQVRIHRWVIEQSLGRKLTRDEHVHHIDGNSLNNDISNLVVLSNSKHQKLELKERSRIKSSKHP